MIDRNNLIQFGRMNFLNENGLRLVFVFIYFLMASTFDDTATAEQRKLPLVINTWPFTEATKSAWEALNRPNGNVFDAVEEGCSKCEQMQCDGSVGFGGHPDENGLVSLDAMIIDGKTQNVGAVASMRRVKNAISVARKVLENTKHTLLVGYSATEFAEKLGFTLEPLETELSNKQHQDWLANNCQPNFWSKVIPDPAKSCGPYHVSHSNDESNEIENYTNQPLDIRNHDTIGMIAIDRNKQIAVGTSTNGASHKIPGRVGDTAIPGSGGYADSNHGAAVCTGDGDLIMRFAPSSLAVYLLEQGKSPTEAANLALKRVYEKYPENQAAIVVANKDGDYGAACFGMDRFPYSIRNNQLDQVQVHHIDCFDKK